MTAPSRWRASLAVAWALRFSLAFAISLPAPAHAAVDAAAYAAFTAGDYQRAADLAGASKRAEDAALAARALNALAYFEDDRKAARDIAERALTLAERAIAADPKLVDGHLQAGISLSLRGARMAPPRAFLLNIPARSRRALDAALALEPDNAFALSTSAAWRLEVARRGGGATYGASPEQGHAECLRARALAPDNVVIAYECALRLLASGRAEWRAAALEALVDARRLPAEIAFDRAVQARAEALNDAVGRGPAAEAAYIAAQP